MSQTEESLEQNYFHRPDAVPGFPFSALTLLVGRQEGKKTLGVGLLVVMILTGALHIF